MPRRYTNERRENSAAHIANLLADILHQLHTTHQDLANRLGVKRYTVDLWARATNPALPSADNLERLCRWLEARQPGLSRQFVAAAFNAAWDRGSALAMEETVALALSIDGQCPVRKQHPSSVCSV